MSARLFDAPDSRGRYPFQWRGSANTDVATTIAAAKKRIEAEKAAKPQPNVTQLKKKARGD